MFGSICNEGVVIVATDGHFGFEGGVFHLRSSFTWRWWRCGVYFYFAYLFNFEYGISHSSSCSIGSISFLWGIFSMMALSVYLLKNFMKLSSNAISSGPLFLLDLPHLRQWMVSYILALLRRKLCVFHFISHIVSVLHSLHFRLWTWHRSYERMSSESNIGCGFFSRRCIGFG